MHVRRKPPSALEAGTARSTYRPMFGILSHAKLGMLSHENNVRCGTGCSPSSSAFWSSNGELELDASPSSHEASSLDAILSNSWLSRELFFEKNKIVQRQMNNRIACVSLKINNWWKSQNVNRTWTSRRGGIRASLGSTDPFSKWAFRQYLKWMQNQTIYPWKCNFNDKLMQKVKRTANDNWIQTMNTIFASTTLS